MDRDQHRAWLADLAAEDHRKRQEAEPELARKEAALREAREHLARSQEAARNLETELDANQQSAGGAGDD
jgi:hypothetical protein